MNDWDIRKTVDEKHEWTVNDFGGKREVELEYEYCCGPTTSSMAIDRIFLTREDLQAMIDAL